MAQWPSPQPPTSGFPFLATKNHSEKEKKKHFNNKKKKTERERVREFERVCTCISMTSKAVSSHLHGVVSIGAGPTLLGSEFLMNIFFFKYWKKERLSKESKRMRRAVTIARCAVIKVEIIFILWYRNLQPFAWFFFFRLKKLGIFLEGPDTMWRFGSLIREKWRIRF